MTPEQKVTSLETSKALKEAGFPQTTERYWMPKVAGTIDRKISGNVYEVDAVMTYDEWYVTSDPKEMMRERISAPDAQELINEIRGNEIAIGYNDSGCFWHFAVGGSGAGSFLEGCGLRFSAVDGEELPDALALLWLQLKK